MTTRTRKVGQADAQAALRKVRRYFLRAGYSEQELATMSLIMDWDWVGGRPAPAIVWEDGPYEWAPELTGSGQVALNTQRVFAEPITNWSIGLYPGW